MTDEKDKAAAPPKDDAEPKEESAKAAVPETSEKKSDPPPAKDEAKDEPKDEPKMGADEEPEERAAAVAAKVAPKEDAPKTDGEPQGAAWASPLMRFDIWWTKQEARLVLAVLGAEILSLTLWVLLKGLSNEYRPGSADISGLVFRGTITAVVLGYVTHRLLRPKSESDAAAVKRHQYGVSLAVLAGVFAGRLWASAGAEYFSNLLNWLQSASTLTLFGGLRGVATRLTLWVALLGASLATAQGKHINVDVVMRFLPIKMRVPVAILGWMAACVVCATGAYGFVDHLSIAEYKIMQQGPCEGDPTNTCTFTVGKRLSLIKHEIGRDAFLLGRQMSLDLKTGPRVLGGNKYKDYLHAAEWNPWLKNGGWTEYFPADDVNGQLMDESDANATRLPIVNIPGTGEDTNGLLRRDVDFIFPFGLLMIALRFLIRSILAIAGYIKVDPDAVHGDPEILAAHPGKEIT